MPQANPLRRFATAAGMLILGAFALALPPANAETREITLEGPLDRDLTVRRRP